MVLSVTRLAIFLSAGFLASSIQAAEGGVSRSQRLNDFAGRGWGFEIGRSLTEVKRLGKVLREEVSSERNRHVDGQIDESRVLHFDGLVIQAYFPAKNHNDLMVAAVTIAKRKWPVRHDLRVGSTWATVKEKLGDPNEETASAAKYCGDNDCAIFSLRNGRVSKITWDLYLD